jgi:hypothetical protein
MILSTENVFSCDAIASALSAKITATDSPIDFAYVASSPLALLIFPAV